MQTMTQAEMYNRRNKAFRHMLVLNYTTGTMPWKCNQLEEVTEEEAEEMAEVVGEEMKESEMQIFSKQPPMNYQWLSRLHKGLAT